ncbi:MAG: hypothetical protein NT067_04410 [Candidatus Diapherotrites archaeon]|nr:hypothetical protein [Candidatus Diapherotrites archaeon]
MELKIDFSNRRTIAGLIILVCAIMLVFYLPGLIIQTNPDVCIGKSCRKSSRAAARYISLRFQGLKGLES